MRWSSGSFHATLPFSRHWRITSRTCVASTQPATSTEPSATTCASVPSTGPVVITGEQIRTRRRASRMRFAMLHGEVLAVTGREPGAQRRRCQRGSTKPLRATSPVCHSCSKSSVNALAIASSCTTATTFSCRVHESSVQLSEPVQTVALVADDELVVHQVGDAGDRLSLDGEAGDQQHVRLGRRRHRDRVRVVDVVGEAHAHATVGRAAHRVPDDARVLLAEREVVVREVERIARRRRRSRRRAARSRPAAARRPSEFGSRCARSLIAWLPPASGARPTSTGTAPAPRSGGTGSPPTSNSGPARRSSSSARRRATAARAISGLPFTSERQLTGAGPAEATATIVQRVLAELGATESVLLWNIVPTHPGTETTNRAPSRDEIAAGSAFAFELARGRRAIAVGRIAADDARRAVRPAPVARRRSRLRRRAWLL